MALAASTIWSVRTDGSDTTNGGCFDPGQTAGMFSDGAATSATGSSPVFTSASYNFVAGDVNAWLYIASGTNWTPGWYQIASVASNAATLSAAVGAASNTVKGLNTVAGCATTASPTGATWSIDYSKQASAQFTYTDLASTGAGLTVSSAAKPFAKQQVGNSIIITGGTNFTTGVYVIASVAAGVATVVGPNNITTGAGSSGTGGQGGAFSSPGFIGLKRVASNGCWIKKGTYSITSASTNTSGGCVALGSLAGATATTPDLWIGYDTVPGDFGNSLTATKPLLQASGAITTFTLIAASSAYAQLWGIDVDAASKSGGAGILLSGNRQIAYGCKTSNCTIGISATGNSDMFIACEATNCSSASGAIRNTTSGLIFGCYAHDNTTIGIIATATATLLFNLSINNTGASSDGIVAQAGAIAVNNIAYGNGRHGFYDGGTAALTLTVFINNISVNNSGWGYSAAAVFLADFLSNNAAYNNSSGNFDTTNFTRMFSNITLTGSPFTNAGSGDFSLNGTGGAGAACRAAGIPTRLPGLTTTTGYLDLGAFQHLATSESSLSFFR